MATCLELPLAALCTAVAWDALRALPRHVRNQAPSMSGPTLVIELPEPLPSAVLREFRALLAGLASRLDEQRPGSFDLNVHAERLGVEDGREDDRRRPFLVYLMGPGVGDETIFEAEHADEPEVEAALGFRPSHAVNVSAYCKFTKADL